MLPIGDALSFIIKLSKFQCLKECNFVLKLLHEKADTSFVITSVVEYYSMCFMPHSLGLYTNLQAICTLWFDFGLNDVLSVGILRPCFCLRSTLQKWSIMIIWNYRFLRLLYRERVLTLNIWSRRMKNWRSLMQRGNWRRACLVYWPWTSLQKSKVNEYFSLWNRWKFSESAWQISLDSWASEICGQLRCKSSL